MSMLHFQKNQPENQKQKRIESILDIFRPRERRKHGKKTSITNTTPLLRTSTPQDMQHEIPPRLERRRHKRVEYFMFKTPPRGFIPVWLFAPEDERDVILGILMDISEGGACILVSRACPPFSSMIRLSIVSPDDSVVEEFDIQAQERWSDEQYSASHKRVGVQFQEMTLETSVKVGLLTEAFRRADTVFFRCKITPLKS